MLIILGNIQGRYDINVTSLISINTQNTLYQLRALLHLFKRESNRFIFIRESLANCRLV